ncbi:hypothetical protein BGZ76_006877, partial [Entomortierella beljakovae]
AAVSSFADWTEQQVNKRKDYNQRYYGKAQDGEDEKTSSSRVPPVYVIYLGHSMGGLVAADSAILLDALPGQSPVIGIMAFDTPYFGLNQSIFTQAAYDRVSGAAQKASGAYSLFTAAAALTTFSGISAANEEKKKEIEAPPPEAKSTPKSTTSSSGSKWGWGSIALGVGAAVVAAGAAAVVSQHLGTGMEYVSSHVEFVGILWNTSQLRE